MMAIIEIGPLRFDAADPALVGALATLELVPSGLGVSGRPNTVLALEVLAAPTSARHLVEAALDRLGRLRLPGLSFGPARERIVAGFRAHEAECTWDLAMPAGRVRQVLFAIVCGCAAITLTSSFADRDQAIVRPHMEAFLRRIEIASPAADHPDA